jgi:HAMP domain-containing protein
VRLTLRMKIIGGFLVAVLATLVLGLYAASSFSGFADRSEASARASQEKISRVAEIESQIILGNLYGASTYNSPTPEGKALARPLWLETTAQATERFMAFRNVGLSPQALAIYNRVSHAVSWNNKLSNSFMRTQFPVPDESVAIPTVQELMADGGLAADVKQKEMRAGLSELRTQIASDASVARADVKADADGSLQRLGALVAVICLALLAFAVGLSYLLVRRLRSTVQTLNQVAEGDLTARAPEGGSDEVAEMGAALNSSLNTIHDVVRQIEEDAERLSSLAREQLVPNHAVSGHASGTTVVMADSTRNARELAEMADNLNAMIMVFQTAKDPEPVA